VNPAKIGTAVGAHVPPDAPKADIQLQILGLLRIWHRDVELDAGPRQQAYLLALLLARAGRPLSVDSLIDLIWGDPELAVRTVERRTLNLEHPNAYYLDIFARLCWCWARARTGDDPHAAATEAETILTRHLLSPPMGGVAFNCALVPMPSSPPTIRPELPARWTSPRNPCTPTDNAMRRASSCSCARDCCNPAASLPRRCVRRPSGAAHCRSSGRRTCSGRAPRSFSPH